MSEFTAPSHGAGWPAWLRRMVREAGPQEFAGQGPPARPGEKGRRLRVIHSLTEDGRYETLYLPEDGGKL